MSTLRRTLGMACLLCLFTLCWMLGLTRRRRRLANLQPHPGWRSVLAPQGNRPFKCRPVEGDLHVYAARGVLASDRSACC
jgi:hypothetical protein